MKNVDGVKEKTRTWRAKIRLCAKDTDLFVRSYLAKYKCTGQTSLLCRNVLNMSQTKIELAYR